MPRVSFPLRRQCAQGAVQTGLQPMGMMEGGLQMHAIKQTHPCSWAKDLVQFPRGQSKTVKPAGI